MRSGILRSRIVCLLFSALLGRLSFYTFNFNFVLFPQVGLAYEIHGTLYD